ncbi:MAG: hypothetical protein GY756_05710, partial [bacterium]|nr:hypothetical protein [bacterium]
FKIKLNKTKVKYDLYSESQYDVSGILQPFERLKDDNGNYIYNRDIGPMDVLSNIAYDETVSPISLINLNEQAELTHLLYPAYDNYVLTAQGISGSIKPHFNEVVQLSTSQLWKQEGVTKTFSLNKSVANPPILNQQDLSLKLNNRLHFYFKNSQSSFLRTNINSFSLPSGDYEMKYDNSQAIEGTTYASNFTPNGDKIVNNNRKRDGQFIETFTNDDINSSNTNGWFLEAKGINRMSSNNFPSIGVGGFRVTALDGKVYHYSLPVYNYELSYKNFHNENDEDKNFFLNTKEASFATHWLLTAITGPDYIDTNSDDKLDKNDYGYWVEFEYGKWTDGYIWKGATGDYDVVKGDGNNDDTYEYYRGRKQIYYLDAVKTRTHTAYFIKSLRKDSKGEEYKYNKTPINSTTYDIFEHVKAFKQSKSGYNSLNSSLLKEYPNVPDSYTYPNGN